MLYRIAIQTNTIPPKWRWKSTPLRSIDAVLRFLRLYRALPQDRLRVFSAASREDLDEQFNREQSAMGMHSVTAAHFLRERLISSGDAVKETSVQKTPQHQKAVADQDLRLSSLYASSKRAPTMAGMSSLDGKRLEIEQGAGGDHDLAYRFAFPVVWPQVQAWTELLVKVQRDELQP